MLIHRSPNFLHCVNVNQELNQPNEYLYRIIHDLQLSFRIMSILHLHPQKNEGIKEKG